jgi:hypothetical protein
MASAVALVLALLATPILIRTFQTRGVGQQIREDGPQAASPSSERPSPAMSSATSGAARRSRRLPRSCCSPSSASVASG